MYHILIHLPFFYMNFYKPSARYINAVNCARVKFSFGYQLFIYVESYHIYKLFFLYITLYLQANLILKKLI